MILSINCHSKLTIENIKNAPQSLKCYTPKHKNRLLYPKDANNVVQNHIQLLVYGLYDYIR